MAYNAAKVKDILPPDTAVGRIKVLVSFTGNAGEPEIIQEYWLDGSQTAAQIQTQVAAKAAALNSVVTTRGQISVGQSVSIVAPVATVPTPTAADTFTQNLITYRHMLNAINMGIKTAADADVAAMKNTLQTTYLDAYLNFF